MSDYLFFPMTILVMGVNGLWYIIKGILSKKDYEVNYWHGHFKDISNFSDLIKKTTDPSKRREYQLMFRTLIFFYLLLQQFIYFLLSINNSLIDQRPQLIMIINAISRNQLRHINND